MSRIDEARDVFTTIEKAWENGEKTALLTITEVEGSAYRLPGAKMMMSEGGDMLGTLSGGCLEPDLYGWAKKVMKDGIPRLVNYDLSETELWTLGIGCKGTLEVLIVPIERTDSFWQAVRDSLKSDRNISLAIELPTGTCVLFDEDKVIAGDETALPESIKEKSVARRQSRTRAEVKTVENRRFYIDTMRPNERLIICGAGHDVEPLAKLATDCAFRVTILDPRREFNNSERFPTTDHIISEPEAVDVDELNGNWWLIMNHLQRRDEAALQVALKANPRFVGVLGPLSRTHEMLENIAATMDSGPIYAPVGLDIGGETIQEVAVSIVSELLAVRTARPGKSLHGRKKIHV